MHAIVLRRDLPVGAFAFQACGEEIHARRVVGVGWLCTRNREGGSRRQTDPTEEGCSFVWQPARRFGVFWDGGKQVWLRFDITVEFARR